MKKMKKLTAVALAIWMLCTLLTACGGSDSAGGSDMSTSDSNGMAFDTMESTTGDIAYDDAMTSGGSSLAGQGISGVRENAKVIRRASMDMQTKDFDSANQALAALVEDLGGYFESRDLHNRGTYRSGSFVVRVPVEAFDVFCTQAGQLCHLTFFSAADEDVSEAYYDVEARLTTQRTKLERLQELLSKAESMEDIITIESAISETELEIEYLTGSLRKYDSLIDYGTINININEVYRLSNEEEPATTFGGRLSAALSGGWASAVNTAEDLLVFIAYNWMALLMLVVIAGAVITVVRRKKRKEKVRREVKQEEDETK